MLSGLASWAVSCFELSAAATKWFENDALANEFKLRSTRVTQAIVTPGVDGGVTGTACTRE